MSDRGRGRGGRGRGDSQYSESGRGRGNYEERGNNRGRGGFDSNRGRGGAQKSRDVVIPNDRNLKLISNMYKVDSKLDEVYRYEVGFFSLTGLVRSIPSKRLRRLIVVELGKLFDKLTPIAYDGVSILYTLKPLAVGAELKPPKEFYDNKPTVDRPKQEITITTGIPDSKIEVDDERALLAKELDNKVSITYTRGAPTIAYDSNAIHVVVTMPESKVKADKAGSGKIVVQLKQTSITWNDESKAQMLSIATIYSSYKQRSDSVVRGSSVFFTGKAEQFLARNLISDLQLFTGVFQSYRKADIGLVLNVDVSFMVALGNWKISDWFDIRAKGEKFRSVSEAFQDKKFREKINKEIKGMDVRVNYGFKRKYRIDSIDFDRNSQNTTFMVENKKMNLQQYMKEKYNCKIDNGTFPLLVARKGKAPASNNNNVSEQAPTYIVPELCSFTEAQKRRAILNSEERAWMIDKTRSNPAERFAVIDDLAKGVTDNDYLKRFPVRFDHSSPIITPGYVLKPQKVEFAKSVTEVPDNKGSWNFKGKIMKLTNPNKLEWAIVYFPEFNKVVDQFLDIFYEQASKLNISLAPNPYKFSTKSINTSDYEATTRTLKNPPPNIKPPKFILFILPDSQSERHHALKRIADIELKIPSKCFVDDGKKTFIPNVVANVLSTINTKVGGYNWTMDSNFKSFIPQSASVLCVMGLDVCHGNTSYVDSSASSGSGNAQSSVALCASYVPSYNKYYTSLRFQDARREVVFEIKQMVIEALKAFRAKNNRLPTDILFYRDGVGEGMYDQVKEWEIKQMKYGMGELYGEAKLPNPRLTFVVVQKRNHLRTQVLQDNESLNPPPGTSITTTVTDKDTNNFYLYSHYALQGTAKPTHYQVLEDGCGFGKNLVEVTYGLSHLHQGCTRSISIPVPVFYADNAAGRANDYYSGFSKIVPNEIQEGFTV